MLSQKLRKMQRVRQRLLRQLKVKLNMRPWLKPLVRARIKPRRLTGKANGFGLQGELEGTKGELARAQENLNAKKKLAEQIMKAFAAKRRQS